MLLLSLVPLRFFAERERASEENDVPLGPPGHGYLSFKKIGKFCIQKKGIVVEYSG